MLDRTLIDPLRNNREIKILCAASSSGEEPYSIAATCIYAKNLYKSTSPIKITATDIDTNMLDLAKKGEYTLDPQIHKIPEWVELDKYFDVTKLGRIAQLKVKSSLKSLVTFQQLNLFNKTYPFTSNDFDLIFCRNVLIYFESKNQEAILEKLHHVLKVDGTLYLGHSEDVLGLKDRFDKLGNKIFVKKSVL